MRERARADGLGSVRLFDALIRQDILFFDERKSGDLLNRLTSDVQNLKSSVKSTISQGLKAVTQTVGGLVSLYWLSPPLTLFLFATLPCLVRGPRARACARPPLTPPRSTASARSTAGSCAG